MIYRVVIIDNGNQVSLSQQGEATPNFEIVGVIDYDTIKTNIMIEALEKLKEAIEK